LLCKDKIFKGVKDYYPMDEWEEKGRYANLKIIARGNKRRLVNEKGEVVIEYTVE